MGQLSSVLFKLWDVRWAAAVVLTRRQGSSYGLLLVG